MNQAVGTFEKSNVTNIISIVMQTAMVFVTVSFITAPNWRLPIHPLTGK